MERYWCFQCQQETESNLYARQCNRCGSPAIEKVIQNTQHPSQFRPYVVGTNSSNERYEITDNEEIDTVRIPIIFEIQTILISPIDDPFNVTVIQRLIPAIGLPGEERKTVSEQVIGNFEKLDYIDECAICQESGKYAVKLPCSHNFHQHCIRPWFNTANTCPCCRTQIQE